MMRTMWSTMTLFALLVGISGCYVPYRGGWQGHPYDRGDRAPHYANNDRDPGSRDCWRQGNDWVCRRGY
jgi:hypothetical protein